MVRAKPEPVYSIVTDFIFVALAAFLTLNYVRAILAYAATPLLVAREALLLVFLLAALILLAVRSPAKAYTSKRIDYVYTILGFTSPLVFRPHPGGEPFVAGVILEVSGSVLVAVAFLSLNRSFGLAPENRGIKRRGAYLLVRHPMYLGYMVTELGYLLDNFSVFNLMVLALSVLFLLLRMRSEERLLQLDPDYMSYAERTRWKLVPFLF